MSDYEYRIEYTTQRGKVSEGTGFADEFEEIGFGSSGGWQDVDAALEAAEQRAAEYAAVVEKALSHDPLHGADSGLHCGGMAPCIRDILTTAPADALREHDAAIIEGLADEFAARLPDGTGNGRVYNSHTVARMLREKARQRREEKG